MLQTLFLTHEKIMSIFANICVVHCINHCTVDWGLGKRSLPIDLGILGAYADIYRRLVLM